MNKTILMGIGMMVGGIFFTVLGIYLMVKSDIPEYDASQGTWSGPTLIREEYDLEEWTPQRTGFNWEWFYEASLEQRVSALEVKVEELMPVPEYEAYSSLLAHGRYRLNVTRIRSDYVVVLTESDDIRHVQLTVDNSGAVFVYYITHGDLCAFYLSADKSDTWDATGAWVHYTNIDGGQQ